MASLITLWTRFGAAAQNDFTGSDPGQTLLNQHFARQSGDTLTLAIESQQTITDPAVKTRVAQALAPFANAPHVTGVAGPYATPGHLAAGGHIGYATIAFDVSGAHISTGEATALVHDAAAASGHSVTQTGLCAGPIRLCGCATGATRTDGHLDHPPGPPTPADRPAAPGFSVALGAADLQRGSHGNHRDHDQ